MIVEDLESSKTLLLGKHWGLATGRTFVSFSFLLFASINWQDFGPKSFCRGQRQTIRTYLVAAYREKLLNFYQVNKSHMLDCFSYQSRFILKIINSREYVECTFF